MRFASSAPGSVSASTALGPVLWNGRIGWLSSMVNGGITEMKSEHIVQEEASWKQIRQWDKLRGDMETSIARALQIKLDRLGEKEWLKECESEMGWGRTQAYTHLNPQGMAKDRERKSRPEIPDVASRQEPLVPVLTDVIAPEECPRPSKDKEMDGFVMSLNLLADNCVAMSMKMITKTLRGGRYDRSVLIPQMERILTTLNDLLKELRS